MGHAEVQFPFLSFDALGSHTIQMNSAWRTTNLVRAEQVLTVGTFASTRRMEREQRLAV